MDLSNDPRALPADRWAPLSAEDRLRLTIWKWAYRVQYDARLTWREAKRVAWLRFLVERGAFVDDLVPTATTLAAIAPAPSPVQPEPEPRGGLTIIRLPGRGSMCTERLCYACAGPLAADMTCPACEARWGPGAGGA